MALVRKTRERKNEMHRVGGPRSRYGDANFNLRQRGAAGDAFAPDHVIGKSRLVQPAPPCDEREGLNFKSPSKVHKTFRPSPRLISLPIFRVLAHSHFQGPRATRQKTSIGIHTILEFLLSFNPAFLFLSPRAAYTPRFTRCQDGFFDARAQYLVLSR